MSGIAVVWAIPFEMEKASDGAAEDGSPRKEPAAEATVGHSIRRHDLPAPRPAKDK